MVRAVTTAATAATAAAAATIDSTDDGVVDVSAWWRWAALVW